MSGGNLFLDTNVILFLLNGDEHLAGLLHEKAITVSFITELELLGYQHITETEHHKIEEFLNSVTVIDINANIKTISTHSEEPTTLSSRMPLLLPPHTI